jgi:phosphatidylcholine synthase
MPVTAVLCAIALYIVCGDAVIRLLRREIDD